MTSPNPRKEGSGVSTPAPPPLDGLHHLKIPVTDPVAAAGWWKRLLGAARLPQWDHVDADGTLFGVLIQVPGLPGPDDRQDDGPAALRRAATSNSATHTPSWNDCRARSPCR